MFPPCAWKQGVSVTQIAMAKKWIGIIKYPNEHIWERIHSKNHELAYLITSKHNDRGTYFAYARDGDGFVKLGKGKSPVECWEKFIVPHQKGSFVAG